MTRQQSVNPATGEVNGEYDVAEPKEVEAAIVTARAAQVDWAKRSLHERLFVLKRFQKEVLAARVEIAALITKEAGKPIPEALAADVLPALDAVEFIARDGRDILGGSSFRLANPLLMDRKSQIQYEPRGVIGIISPWNYPFGIPASQVVFALFAGNAVVLKPSEYTTLTALKMAELFDRANLPKGLLQIVPGPGPLTGDALARSDVDFLIFTGSVPVGHSVDATCRARGVATCLELGGSDPAIVLEDADLDLAANGIAWARFTNAGQTCAAAKRVYVVDAVADTFTNLLVDKVKRLRVGNGSSPNVDMGPLIDAKFVKKMEEFVTDAVSKGAVVMTGGKRVPGPGNFFEPTILSRVPADARMLNEEVFGPVLPIVRVPDDDAAVRLANDSDFGLTASVWTRDTRRGERIAAALDTGTVTINDHVYTYAAVETPWGGVKDSGHGRTHGAWGLLEMTKMKHVNVAPTMRAVNELWWFPYNENAQATFDEGLDFLYGGLAAKAKNALPVAKKVLTKKTL
ncbi:MAG: aldehyde dehydrogenase family protein [Thermoplasmatota archaeon]